MTEKIEVEFAIPVEIRPEDARAIYDLVDKIARYNTPEGQVHWAFGAGDKPIFSQADLLFLGKPVDPKAPARGEPTWDSTVYHITTACREAHGSERDQVPG